jgi:hypothetical protein
LLAISLSVAEPASADEPAWIELSSGAEALKNWVTPGKWYTADDVALDPKNDKLLKGTAGKEFLVNGPTGRTNDLVTKQKFGDLEVHTEFFIPKKSNSGVKLLGMYEIQIFDSFGVKKMTGADCGGIYPRAEMLPTYHHIDDGFAPKVNAAKPAGEWQTLDIIFLTPRFDKSGAKTASARFVKVVLNGKVVQEDVETPTPTGHAWHNKEVAEGPLLLQGDHGPVAFRNLRVRPYVVPAKGKP